MILLIKNIATVLFIAFLMLVSLVIPTSALLNNPIFDNHDVQSFYFDNTKIFRSSGFSLSNVNQQRVLVASPEQETPSLYDLYLDFDDQDFTNNYTILKDNYEKNFLQKQKGERSAKFVSKENSIILFPKSESILKNNTIQNFTVSFYLYPYRTGEGVQYIVSYEGYYTNSVSEVRPFGFSITIEKGIVNYSFTNFFIDEEGIYHSFELQEQQPLINTQWEQHTLVVDITKSIIKIYRNHIEQDTVFVRQNNVFNGRRLYPSPQFAKIENIPFTIGRNGIFSLDSFVIYRDSITNFMEYTPNKKLFFETDVFCISRNVSSLYEMNINVSSTNEYYRLAYRISNSYFLPDTQTIDKPWIYIDPTKKQFPPSQSQGKYIQWRVEYITATEESNQPFYIKDIFARFKETYDPSTIQINSVLAKDGAIEISWQTLPNDLVVSYEIYYGNCPNYYFGKAEVSPQSPIVIDVAKSSVSQNIAYILEGLDNEIPYYISIRAKDIYGQYGSFSPEIVSRPSSVKNDFGYSIGR
ncbi:MAG: hypothetical protein ACRCWI_04995 [Brevinema sp.]